MQINSIQWSGTLTTTTVEKVLPPFAAAKSPVVSDAVRPHRCQPTRLPCLWDSPGKNTGVGCHFLFQ